MRLVRIIIGVTIFGISLGVSSIAPFQILTRTSSVYAQGNVLERSSKSNGSKSSAYHKTSFQTLEDLFKFGEPNPDNLKKSPGRDWSAPIWYTSGYTRDPAFIVAYSIGAF
jgi:hypothetical protein